MASPDYITKVFTNYKKENFFYADRSPQRLTFNLFTPVSATGAPVGDAKKPLIWSLHGGGSSYIAPQTEAWAIDEFCPRGFAVGCLDYKPPREGAGQDDVNQAHIISGCAVLCATRMARFNKNLLSINPNFIFSMGTSWGGLTSIHASIIAHNLSDPYFGDSLNTLYTNDAQGKKIKSNLQATGSSAGAAYPHIRAYLKNKVGQHHDHHGEDDTTVPYQYAVDTQAEMIALGIPSTLTSYPHTGHTVGHESEIAQYLAEKFAFIIKGVPT